MIQLTTTIIQFLNEKGFYQFYNPHMWKKSEWSDMGCVTTEEVFKMLAKTENKKVLEYLSDNNII